MYSFSGKSQVKHLEDKSRENWVQEFFGDCDIYNISPSKTKLSSLPDRVERKLKEHPMVTDEIPKGFPDLILDDGENIIYVEEKFGKDGLRELQARFLTKSSKDSYVAYIPNRAESKTVEYKCENCGERFNSEHSYGNHSCMVDFSGYGQK